MIRPLLVLLSLFFLLPSMARAQTAEEGSVAASITAMQLGGTVTYSIWLRNASPSTVGGVLLAGSLPAGSAFRRQGITPLGAIPAGVSRGDSPRTDAAAVVWRIDHLSAAQTIGPFTYQVDVPANADPASLAAHASVSWDSPTSGQSQSLDAFPPPIGAKGLEPVTPETLDGTTLRPVADLDGVKRVTLTASVVDQEILNAEGKRVVGEGFGFNGSTPGPTLVFTIGDRVEITVLNNLPEATSVHWHGVILPNEMDGAPDVEPTPRIQPGESFTYHFTVQQTGTHIYHSHTDTAKQDLLGLAGALIFLPAHETGPRVDHDYVFFLNEWKLPQDMTPDQIKDMPRIGSPVDTVNSVTAEPDWTSNQLNFFTINGKSFPSTTPLDVRLGERVRLRFFNVGLSTHPMHLHGQDFLHTEQDGNLIAPDNQPQLNTIPVAPGQTQVVEFYALNPGVWPLHCHIAHHQTNNLSSGLGGMATVVRITGEPVFP